ncbi:MAG TPA: 6-phosphogluconolactonase [Candidatus Paceibacterota bacterium]
MNTTNKKQFKIEPAATPEKAAEAAGKYVGDVLAQYVDTPVLLLLAGGSSVKILEHISSEYLSELLTVTVTDERFSEELDENNFAILQAQTFYNELVQVDAMCIDTQIINDESFEGHRARFENNIREWKRDFPNGKIVAVYGMGEDGHTAGIIPGILSKEAFDLEFNNDDKLVGKLDATGKNPFPLRDSTTLPFMRNWVDHAAFFVTGSNKKEMLERAILPEDEQKSDLFELPAQVMVQMKDVLLFTDISSDAFEPFLLK